MKLIDILFPKCKVYKYNEYIGKKRVFILKYLLNTR